jgi:hypothetical protein
VTVNHLRRRSLMLTERTQFSKTRLKRILILVVFLMLLITILLYVYAFQGLSINPDIVFINTSDIKDGKLVLSGSTVSSAMVIADIPIE